MKQMFSKEEVEKIVKENAPKLYTHNISAHMTSIDEEEWTLYIQVLSTKKETFTNDEMETIFTKISENDYNEIYNLQEVIYEGDRYRAYLLDETNLYFMNPYTKALSSVEYEQSVTFIDYVS